METEYKVSISSFIVGIVLLIIFLVLPWGQEFLGVKVVLFIGMIVCFFITIYMILEKLGAVEVLDDIFS
ncbi:hypothetical protein LCGC14_0697840 [marine sediment metagenome]|uniref:Uncharacterized protein n=1 Tax=marine sediment metagenome TaxID=412755 RepID=A0A0F9QIQ2_9ZZZZ|nr:MAG: hypothetical protein Lokiarch_09240 [Candidatus Lokiarchaeum sp. GC14_75]